MPHDEEIALGSSKLSALSSPLRTCIVTRTEHPKAELLRFVVSPEGLLVADLNHKLPGRGIYVTCSRLSVAEALAKRLFSRAAKQQVQIPADFLDRLTRLMETRVLEALSMARKGGLVISGFEKVEEALKKGEVAALIHASDAGEDGKKKLAAFTSPTGRGRNSNAISGEGMDAASGPHPKSEDGFRPLPPGEVVPTYDFLSREALGNVVGRENAVHVAVGHGMAAAFFMREARRFALFLL